MPMKMYTPTWAVSGRYREGSPLVGERQHGQGRCKGIQPQHRIGGAPGSGEWAGGLWAAER